MTRKGQALSVLIVSTLAFTVCFMVWMMFGVIGIPLKKTLGLNATEFGLLTATPVLTGSLITRAAGHLDRPIRRAYRHDGAAGGDGARNLDDGLCHPVLAIPGDRLVSGPGWRLVLGRYTVCRTLVPERPAGFCDGRLWRRQLGSGGQQICRTRNSGGIRLDHGAPGVRRHHARHRHPVLVLQLQRPGPPGAADDQIQRPAQAAQGSQGTQILPVLQHRVRRLCRPEPVDGAVLRR